jgi:aspartate/methionine/tyrosine aminotransferase
MQPGDEVIIVAYWVSYPDMVRRPGAGPGRPDERAQRLGVTAAEFENAMTPRTKW